MGAYAEAYLSDVVENQGKLFDYVAETFPDKDTEDFINFYMQSNTRKPRVKKSVARYRQCSSCGGSGK